MNTHSPKLSAKEGSRTAVVIGGSIAGLLAGRALTHHCDRVLIIERDFYPNAPAPRPGLPQSLFLHVLLLRGQQIFEQFFPGLRNELLNAGAPELSSGSDIAVLTSAGWGTPFDTQAKALSCSRDLLDWTVQRRLAALPNVEFVQGAVVTGLLPTADGAGVAGIELHRRDAPHSDTVHFETLTADLVVDAAGKASHTPTWLQKLGFAAPAETLLDAHLGYAHRLYQIPDSTPTDWQGLLVLAAPPAQTRSAILFPVEGDRWMVGLAGTADDLPPTDDAGYLDFAKNLPTPRLYDAIRHATPLSPIRLYRGNENRLRHYDRLKRYPENLLIVGHAFCAFNPTYGQGMTVAAMEADLLNRYMQQHPDVSRRGYARRLQRHLAAAHQTAWMFATYQDYRFPTATKAPGLAVKLSNWYFDHLSKLITTDADAHHKLVDVMHLLQPPSTLFSPGLMARVMRTI
jgi:2-polyprenyl-6-methoxyphenol hydroxylase-like FAD-dependent oxidoreductase